MSIQTIVIAKKILGYFSVSFPESSMFPFIVIQPTSKLSLGFSNIRDLTTYFTFQRYSTFSELEFKGILFILKVSPQTSVVKDVAVLIELQSYKLNIFSSHMVHISRFH